MNNLFDNRGDANISIRPATTSDALTLARFRYDFRSSLNLTRENEEEFVRRSRLWMEERLRENSPWKCWIAEQGNNVAGNLWVQLIEKIPNPTTEPEHHAYVTNFYVSEGARGRGIGSMLLATALEWAKTQDVQAIILWPTERSRPLYLRHGFAVPTDLLELTIT
jgi:GNAT superfamily N-acetyltransferase